MPFFAMREKMSILLLHQLLGTISKEGNLELQAWLDASPANKATAEELTMQPLLPQVQADRSWNSTPGLLKVRAFVRQQRRIIKMQQLSVAAALLIGISAGVYLSVRESEPEPVIQSTPLNTDSIATPRRAELTLSGGLTVRLDSVLGAPLNEGEDLIVKIDSNHILYSHSNKAVHQHTQPVYNTLALPYSSNAWKISLPSGTVMFLDGGSTISYPITPGEGDSRLSLHGLGFFDVATEYAGKSKKNFIVNANGVETEVTGTRFTINSFPEDSVVKTTLLSGSVIVTNKKRRVKLKPAQAATFDKVKGGDVKYENVDTTNSLVWLDGIIDLGYNPSTVNLKRIARAYGIAITYKNEAVYKQMLDFILIGEMKLDHSLSIVQLAKQLEDKFKIAVKVMNNNSVIEVQSLYWYDWYDKYKRKMNK